MSESKHTPINLEVIRRDDLCKDGECQDYYHINAGCGYHIGNPRHHGFGLAGYMDPADAERLKRAWDCHDDLLEACRAHDKANTAYAKALESYPRGPLPKELNDEIDMLYHKAKWMIRAAIAKAEGREP